MDEAALHELLSGRRRDLGADALRGGLFAASCVYSGAMTVRNFAYQRHWLRVHRASVPVISLGNITTGGTGKTPMAAFLANWYVTHGFNPGLLSRGYHALEAVPAKDGSTSDAPAIGNDEKRVLDRLCPNVPHIQQRDRVASAQTLIRDDGCDVILLDDGFQHRRLHRDLDLVLVDALQPWGYGHVLPRGLLREPLKGLARADLILITRADQATAAQRDELRAVLRRYRGTDECVETAFRPTGLVDLRWETHSLDSIKGENVLAFCGIGNPIGFRHTVESLTGACEQFQAFPDHHHYEKADLQKLEELADKCSATAVLTTQKDLVKIGPDEWQGPPLRAIEIGAEFLSGFELLQSRLRSVF